MKRKVKLLSDKDVQELVKFQQYLADKQTMTVADLHRKYQEYVGISDAEMATLGYERNKEGEHD